MGGGGGGGVPSTVYEQKKIDHGSRIQKFRFPNHENKQAR